MSMRRRWKDWWVNQVVRRLDSHYNRPGQAEAEERMRERLQRLLPWLDRLLIVCCLWLVWSDLNGMVKLFRHPDIWNAGFVVWEGYWIYRLWKQWGSGGWWGGGGWEPEPEPEPAPEEPISA